MASSGYFNTSAYSGRYLQFSWSETTQSITNNTTTISWTLKGAGGDSTWYYTRNIKVTIAGETVYNFPQSKGKVQLGKGTVVASGSYTFTHNDDGTKSFTAYAEAGIYQYAVNCTGSATFTLDTIARASQPSLITYPESTQDVGFFGDTISIHMNRKSSAFTHRVRYAFGSVSGTCVDADTGKAATAVTTGFRWTIPETLMGYIPNSTTGSGTIYVDTYNGSTLIGTKYSGFTARVPDSVKPNVWCTLEDVTGIDDIYGSPVQGLSKIKVTVNAMTAYSSPINAYSIIVGDARYVAQTITTGTLTKAGTVRVAAAVVDKRGRYSSWEYNMNVQAYTPPKITSLSVHRCGMMGMEDEQGEYANVNFTAAVSSMDKKNTCEYVVRYKKSSETAWTSLPQSIYTNSNYAPTASVVFAADGNSSYDVMVTATDRHSTASRSTSVSTAFTMLNWNVEGNGMGIGKVAEKENTLQVDLDVQTFGNQYSFASVGTDGAPGYVRIAEITLKSVLSNNFPITFELVKRAENTSMKVSILFQSGQSALQTIWYEGSNYNAYVSETADSVWGLYVLKYQGSDDVTISRWYTSEIMKDKVSVVFVGDQVSTVPQGLKGYYKATPAILRSMIDCLLPVGTIIHRYDHNDPNTMYPGTTWVRMANTFLWGCDASGIIGQTGGEKTHTLTVDEIPAHTHGSVYSQHASGTKDKAWYNTSGTSVAYGAVSAGGGQAHNNMPPYTQVSIWRRTG